MCANVRERAAAAVLVRGVAWEKGGKNVKMTMTDQCKIVRNYDRIVNFI